VTPGISHVAALRRNRGCLGSGAGFLLRSTYVKRQLIGILCVMWRAGKPVLAGGGL